MERRASRRIVPAPKPNGARPVARFRRRERLVARDSSPSRSRSARDRRRRDGRAVVAIDPAPCRPRPSIEHRCVRRSRAALALVVAVGCRVDAEVSSAGLSAGEGETGGTSAGGSGTAADVTGAATGTTGLDSSTGGGGPKLDVGSMPDLVDPTGAVEPTCDTIDRFPATSVGCVFYAVDLPMSSHGAGRPYGVGIGNPSAELATVTIEDRRGPNGSLREILTVMLAPDDSQMIALAGQGGELPNEDHSIETLGLNARAALRITSDVPITAMQINPVGASEAHTTDGSMLLPKNALDTVYIALGYSTYIWYPLTTGGDIVVVATEDATTVEIAQDMMVLDEFDAWYIENGSDATGTFVSADKPVALFSGTRLTFVPAANVGDAADHLEEQIIPLSGWGTRYVGARHPYRLPEFAPTEEEVYWRVVAGEADATLNVTPALPVIGAQIQLVNVGDHVEFSTTENFVVESDKRFMLVQYMGGTMVVLDGDYTLLAEVEAAYPADDAPTGDPYMAQVIPEEQWLTKSPFLTDTPYPDDFVVISRQAGTQVSLGCFGVVPDDHFEPIPGTSYEVGTVMLDIGHGGGEGACQDGAQLLTADGPVGLLVGGIDYASSYGFPGGMSVEALWRPPTDPAG